VTEGSTVHYVPPSPAAPVAWHILAVRHEHAMIRWWRGGAGPDAWAYGVKSVASLRALVREGSAFVTRTGG